MKNYVVKANLDFFMNVSANNKTEARNMALETIEKVNQLGKSDVNSLDIIIENKEK